jgi:hypothetical protein
MWLAVAMKTFQMSVIAAVVSAENGNSKEAAMKKVVAMKTEDCK